MIAKKRGQIGVTQVMLGLLVLFIVIVIGVVGYNTTQGLPFGTALSDSITSVSGGFMALLGPLFNILFNFGEDSNTNFLMVLTFILISIIIVGTLDSVNIFGEDGQGKYINFAIGIIVSIIGVRFMPDNLWLSLTAPSSAFVATVLVGVPFVALFFVTMKIKFPLINKLLWLFYLVFMSYLIFFPEEGAGVANDFMWIYLIFLVLAGIMMFFDDTVRRFINKEKVKADLQTGIYQQGILSRKELRDEMKKWQKVMLDPDASSEEKTEAKKMLRELSALSINSV